MQAIINVKTNITVGRHTSEMNEWAHGDTIQYFGGEGVVLSVESTEDEPPILTVISDDRLLHRLHSDLSCVQSQ
jgi:hypothetical protein